MLLHVIFLLYYLLGLLSGPCTGKSSGRTELFRNSVMLTQIDFSQPSLKQQSQDWVVFLALVSANWALIPSNWAVLATVITAVKEALWIVNSLSYYSLPLVLFRDNLQHWSGDLPDSLRCTNERMSNDSPMWAWVWDRPPHRGWRPVRFTKSVWGLKRTTEFITCQARLVRRGLRFIVLFREKVNFCRCYYKNSTFCSVILRSWVGLNLRSASQQTGAYPIELTRRRFI